MARPDFQHLFNDHELTQLETAGFQVRPCHDSPRWDHLAEAYEKCGLWKDAEFSCDCFEHCHDAFLSVERHEELDIPDDNRGMVADYLAAYDMMYRGKPFRLCVVSRDSGGATTSFSDRTESATQYLIYSDLDNEKDNTHWIRTLKLVNFILFGEYEIDVNEKPLHRRMFAHVRAVKCSAMKMGLEPKRARWYPPREMYGNCFPHLAMELAVLEPTLIVAQGFSKYMSDDNPCTTWSVLTAMKALLDDAGENIYCELMSKPQPSKEMVAHKWLAPWGTCILLGTYHPCSGPTYSVRRSQTGVLYDELIPAITALREREFEL